VRFSAALTAEGQIAILHLEFRTLQNTLKKIVTILTERSLVLVGKKEEVFDYLKKRN
jgi:hypothetical protein